MKYYINFLLLFMMIQQPNAQNTLNIMTFNIRLDVAEKDSMNNWQYRKERVSNQILAHQTDIVGVQEARPNQMIDLQKLLPEYKYVGLPRENNDWGEYSAIFYNTKRIEVIEDYTFWLSQTPTEVGRKGWDAACPRIVTFALFRDRITNDTFYIFNTHFDHEGQVARRESAKMLLEYIQNIADSRPVLAMGDFNATPSDEPIRIITSQNDDRHLTDSKTASQTPHQGPTGTFNGFNQREGAYPIDYIFIKNQVAVLEHATLLQRWNGYFSSDHFPVFVRVKIN